MVSVKVVSRYNSNFPGVGATARAIPGGPLYPKNEVLALLDRLGTCGVSLWTRKCTEDIQKLALDLDEVVEIVSEALRCGRYISSEWCEQQPTGPWAACDAYELKRRERCPVAKKELEYIYYIKFAIGMAGKILLLVSCHLSSR